MGRIAINDAEHYGNSNSADFFTLKDDRDTAKVRFMYNDIDDVTMDVVHEIEVDGKKKLVNCLRSYDEPVDNCPLCKAHNKQLVKMFVPVYNEDAKKVQIWQRGRTFASQISGLASRYNPLCGTVVEIERQGRKGDQTTKYQLYPGGSDNTTLDDLPEVPDVLGGIVMNKTYDELSDYVERGSFRGGEIADRGDNLPKRRPNF